jgi:hypothetical protein
MMRPSLALVALIGALTLAWGHENGQSPRPDHHAPIASVSLTPTPSGSTAVEVRLEPRDATRGELYLSLTSLEQRGLHHRRVLRPLEPGVYGLEYTFPRGGVWGFYVRFGPGQAGFVGFGRLPITGEAQQLRLELTDGFAREVPPYVQPLGYALFGLLATLALAGTTLLLRRVRQVPQAAS